MLSQGDVCSPMLTMSQNDYDALRKVISQVANRLNYTANITNGVMTLNVIREVENLIIKAVRMRDFYLARFWAAVRRDLLE